MSAATQVYYPRFDARFFGFPPPIQSKIEAKIDQMGRRLASYPHYRMKGTNRYRLRVGDYRVLYTFDVGQNSIHLLAVGPRRDIYREA